MNLSVRKAQGFTVVELMIALVVAIIMLAVGIPAFSRMIDSNQLSASANYLVVSMHFARSSAVTRGVPVALCPSSDGASCTGNTDWSVGWIVFVDNGATKGSRDTGEALLRVYNESSQRVAINGSAAIRFTPLGQLDTSI
jgi:type IV fimbrial biogenesis protein FimT